MDVVLKNVLNLCEAMVADHATEAGVRQHAGFGGGSNYTSPAPHVPLSYYEGKANAASSIIGYIMKQKIGELS